MSTTIAPAGHTSGDHSVRFYEATSDLADNVARYIVDGLAADEPAIIIATPDHRAAFEAALAARSVDVARLKDDGRLVMLDAEATLAEVMLGNEPEWMRFSATLGAVLQRLAQRHPGRAVRAYGEMVDVLWAAGQRTAAVRLEQLWNVLRKHHDFTLLCAYAVSSLASTDDVRAVCSEHTHVVPTDSTAVRPEVRALVSEIAQRTALEQDLQDFIDNAAVAIHRVDRDGFIRYANDAELQLLGYHRDEYIGRHIREFHADRAAIDDILARLARGETLHDYEVRLRAKDGSIRHVVLSSNVQRGHGETTRCFSRDITAQKQAEHEREQASRAKDDFLAVLGHELRNPLSPILTAVQLMRLRGDSASAREQDIIERQVEHLIHIIDDLLDISRIARGKVHLTRRPLKLAPVVAKALEIVAPLYEERHHQLDVVMPSEEIWLEADETRLCQVLVNLLNNAAKYTPKGGTVSVRVTQVDGHVQIRVEDNGSGISADLLPRVFDLFVQGPRDTDRSRGGLGVGLALVKNLVTLHGGTVSAHSDGARRGSTFVVELPTIDASHATPAAPHADGLLRRRVQMTARNILVVDDNEDAGALLAEMLRSVGHDVRVAVDGPRALEVVKHFKPQVAILDLGLPVMDGYELAGELRQRLGASLRLMALTGYGQERDHERSHKAGFEAHLVKPIGLSTILATIEVATQPDGE